MTCSVRYIEKKTSRDFISNFPRYILLLLLLLLVGLQSRAHPSTVFFFKKRGEIQIYIAKYTPERVTMLLLYC